jgi:heparin/heparan-sulfate lyase
VYYLGSLAYSGDGLQMARSGIVQYIAKVYDWCHDLISEENKAFIIKKSLAIATKLECGWPPVKLSAFNSDHGSEGAVQVDMLSLAIAMYEDYPDIWNVSAGRFFAEYVAINNFYYDQSWWQAEGDSYGHSRYTYEAKSHAILDKLGISSLISPNDQYLSYNLIYRRRPDGNFLQDGDIWDITFQNSSPSQYKGSAGSLLSGSFRYKDPYLKYELYKMCENGYQDLANDAGFSLVDFLVLNDVNVGLKSNYDLPLTGYTGEGHNMMTARTGWDDGVDSNTMVVSLKGGGRTRGGHMHADAGNFVIYYKGPLAMDTGVYNGKPFIDENGKQVTNVAAGSYHFANYQQRTIAHNCILVYDPDENMKYHNLGELNDGGQLKHTERVPNTGQTTYKDATDDTKILATRLGVDYGPDMNKPAYSYLKTDITNAYSFKMKEYHRAFMFHNFFDEDYPGALIVMDKVTSSNPEFKKTWLLHSQEEPEVDGQTTTIRRTEWGYNGKLVNQALLPKAEDSVTEKIGGEGKEYWVDGRNVKAIGIVKGDESGKWRIEISPKTPKETDYFLNVLQVSANDKNLEPLKSDLYEIGDYMGVKIKDRATFLTKASKRTSKEVYVHIDGNEEKLLWTVDGLNMGRWSVSDENGNVVATADVTEEGGVAYFEAKAGSYKLTKLRGFNKIPSKNFDIFEGVTEETTPLEPKFAINTLYEYIDDSNPVIDENGIAYIPMDPYFKSVDRLSTYTDEGNTVKLRFEDEDYVVDLNTNKVTKIWQYVEMNGEINVTNNIKRINGKLYIPHTFFTEVFEKVCNYDTFAKIIRLENGFSRPSDYIIASEDPSRINVKATTDEHSAASTKAYMALDGDIAESRWGSEIIGANATYEFTEESVLNKVKIYWYQPTQRAYNYEFQVSEDGVNFKTVLEGNTGYTGESAEYEFEPVKAKYFKVIAKGNILNNWFNMYEIQFFKSN